MSPSAKRPFSRDQRTIIVYGMLVFVLIIVVLQLWLLTATMNAWLGGDDSVVWPAAAVSAGGLALNLGLLRYLGHIERTRRAGSVGPTTVFRASSVGLGRAGTGGRRANRRQRREIFNEAAILPVRAPGTRSAVALRLSVDACAGLGSTPGRFAETRSSGRLHLWQDWHVIRLVGRFRARGGGPMKRLVVGIVAAAVLVSVAGTAMAQTKSLTTEQRTETAIVEAIEAASRTVTLKKSDGTHVAIVAGPEITRFAEIKVGDKVNARYYENVVLRLKRPGEPDVDTGAKSTTPSEQALPGGTKAKQRTITATITAIDMQAPAVTFTGPNGYKYTTKVQDKSALANVKVGDKVDIVWTEALLVSLERGT